MKIKTGDMVVVLAGKDNYRNDKDFKEKGEIKAHKVISADPKGGKVIVEDVNVLSLTKWLGFSKILIIWIQLLKEYLN